MTNSADPDQLASSEGLKGCDYFLKQRDSDHCTICYTDELSKAPVIMLYCRHVFHLHCLKKVLKKKWVGPSITFGFMNCPICKAPVQHENLDRILKPIQDLKADVQRKALTRLTFDNLDTCDDITKPSGRYYNDPEGYALNRYSYYQCFKCKKAYFGGIADCMGQADFIDKQDPKELICGGCSSKDRGLIARLQQVCEQHGTDIWDTSVDIDALWLYITALELPISVRSVTQEVTRWLEWINRYFLSARLDQEVYS